MSGGNRTDNISRRIAAEPWFRPLGQRDQQFFLVKNVKCSSEYVTRVISLFLNVHACAEWGESDDSKDSFRRDKSKFLIILLNSVQDSVRRFE